MLGPPALFQGRLGFILGAGGTVVHGEGLGHVLLGVIAIAAIATLRHCSRLKVNTGDMPDTSTVPCESQSVTSRWHLFKMHKFNLSYFSFGTVVHGEGLGHVLLGVIAIAAIATLDHCSRLKVNTGDMPDKTTVPCESQSVISRWHLFKMHNSICHIFRSSRQRHL